MGRYSIVHASDLHLGAEPNRYTSPIEDHSVWETFCDQLKPKRRGGPPRRFAWLRPATHDEEIFERFADKLTQLEAKFGIDLVILSGDIATTGASGDVASALEGVTAPFADVEKPYLTVAKRPTLSAHGDGIIVLPGNHDRYQPITLRPGNMAFERAFAKYWGPPKLSKTGRVLTHVLPAREVPAGKPRDRLDILCADFSLRATFHQRGFFGYLGQGRAYKDIVDELVNTTKLIKKNRPPAPTIWVIHFPPECDPCPPRLQLLDEESISKAAKSVGVNMILSGHQHMQRRYFLATNKTTVFVAGTASQRSRKGSHSFWHLRFETKLATVINGTATLYQRDDFPGDFVEFANAPL